jgi:hypothetical protein
LLIITQAEVATATGQLKAHADAVEVLVAEETELAQRVQVVSQEYESKNAAANEHREKITKLEQQVSQLRSKAQAAKKRGNTAQLEVKKAANKSAALEKRKKEAAASVAALLKQHAWIAKEKQYFGQPGTCSQLIAVCYSDSSSALTWFSSENRLRRTWATWVLHLVCRVCTSVSCSMFVSARMFTLALGFHQHTRHQVMIYSKMRLPQVPTPSLAHRHIQHSALTPTFTLPNAHATHKAHRLSSRKEILRRTRASSSQGWIP